MKQSGDKKTLTEKERSCLENAIKLWSDYAMNAENPRELDVEAAVIYAMASNRLYEHRTGKPLFTRQGQELDHQGMLDAILETIHSMEARKIAELDPFYRLAFALDANGHPLYEDQHLDYEQWVTAIWGYELYNLKQAKAPQGDQILDMIDWVCRCHPR